MVKATVAWPRRSDTTFGGTPAWSKRGVRVPEVVEPYPWYSGAGDPAVEGVAEDVVMHRPAIGLREHEVVPLVPLGEFATMSGLAPMMVPKDIDRPSIEVDDSLAAFGLGVGASHR